MAKLCYYAVLRHKKIPTTKQEIWLHEMSLNLLAFALLTAFIAPLLCTRPISSRCLIVSVGVSALGTTSIHFVEPGVKVNGRYYWVVLLMQKRLSDIRQLSEFYVYQEESAPAHTARETVDLLTRETPVFTPFTLWPSNSPDFNSASSTSPLVTWLWRWSHV